MNDEYIRKVKVVRVVDGDTIDVLVDLGMDTWRSERLRLLNIDTPEIRTKDAAEKAAGFVAKKWLEDKLNNGVDIYIQTTKTGKYGRYLAMLYVDGVNINDEMVKEGLAKVYG